MCGGCCGYCSRAGPGDRPSVDQLGKLGAETGKWQCKLVRRAITQYLGKTKAKAVDKMSCQVTQLEKPVKVLILTQTE